MSKMKELEKQTLKELQTAYLELSRDIYLLKTNLNVSKKLDKPHLLKQKKKDRARVITAFNKKSKEKA